MQGKKCGYAKFATQESAHAAIAGLNNQTLCGSKLAVLVAEGQRDSKRPRTDMKDDF